MAEAVALTGRPVEKDKSDAAFLRVADLVKTFGGRTAVDGVSFSIAAGECYGLLGPNGAGKTTTIMAICGLIKADSGEISIGEKGRSPSSRSARRHIGYVPQDIALYDDLSGRENLNFFGKLYGLSRAALAERVDHVLDFVDLRARSDDKLASYSGGMKRRINIAAALIHEPGLLVLDEPTVGIDPQSRNAILEQLQELRSQGVALLYTSHYTEEVEQISDRIGIMDHGKLVTEGSVASLLELVGGGTQRITLITASPPSDDLLEALGKLSGVVSAGAGPDGPVLVVADVAEVLPVVLGELAGREIQVRNLAVEAPDLEDVFLHLTGKALRDE